MIVAEPMIFTPISVRVPAIVLVSVLKRRVLDVVSYGVLIPQIDVSMKSFDLFDFTCFNLRYGVRVNLRAILL